VAAVTVFEAVVVGAAVAAIVLPSVTSNVVTATLVGTIYNYCHSSLHCLLL